MRDIPLHKLDTRSNTGFVLKRFLLDDEQDDDAASFGAHRDDHYIFFVLEQGIGSIMIDFNEVKISAPCLFYVLPTQVHHRIKNEATLGWFLAVDTSLIPPNCRDVFEGQLLLQTPCKLSPLPLRQCCDVLNLVAEKQLEDDQDPFYIPAVHSLTQSFLVMAAKMYSQTPGTSFKTSRPHEISQQFKKLLMTDLKTVKSPSEYAARLNVSESYLNEVLKKITGYSVSYWIRYEIVMEAKRLLYYSQLTCKEIAHVLGYEDHAYFGRIFTKTVGMPAMVFRNHYRK